MRRIKTAIVLIVALLVTSCTDKDLEALVESLQKISQTLGTLQQTVISANSSNPKLISDDSARVILQICVRVNQAGLEANKVARLATSMGIEERKKLTTILDPIILLISTTISSSGSFDMSDDRTRSAVMVSLLAIQASLNEAKLALVR